MENEVQEQSAHTTDLKGVTEPVRHAFMAPPTAWDAESAAEAGRRSGEVRRRKAQMSPEERVHDAIRGKLDKLVGELIHAALGEDDFEDLKLETRVTALTRLLEWELGRPAAVKPKEEAAVTQSPSGVAVELGAARVTVARAFDPAALAAVVDVLVRQGMVRR